MDQDKKGTILVVNDDLASLGALFEHLDQAGFKALVAQDGASALKRVKRSQPDVIVVDVKLPDMDGFEVLRCLKEKDHAADIPVIFLAVTDDVLNVLKGLDLAAVDYVTKPFEPEEVVARVEKHLTLHSLQKQLEAQDAQLQQEIAQRKRVEAERHFSARGKVGHFVGRDPAGDRRSHPPSLAVSGNRQRSDQSGGPGVQD